MKRRNKIMDKLDLVIQEALLQLKDQLSQEQLKQDDLLMAIKTFLLPLITAAAEVAENRGKGSASMLYADLESSFKEKGLSELKKIASNEGEAPLSAAHIEGHDVVSGMNYVGQQLSITLFKGLYALPKSLRNQEMMLRSIEALLANLLNQKFYTNAHQILDSFCEHVHLALQELELRQKH